MAVAVLKSAFVADRKSESPHTLDAATTSRTVSGTACMWAARNGRRGMDCRNYVTTINGSTLARSGHRFARALKLEEDKSLSEDFIRSSLKDS